LTNEGYKAFAKNRGKVIVDQSVKRSKLPHKTVATLSGLGWIGKCALLVTRDYGAAVRLTVTLTDAPLQTGKPINKSYCGACTECQKNCPAGAVSGKLWSP
jgi:epoxyqueuosine reductase QueG